MSLDAAHAHAPRRCRLLVLLAGCPSSQNPGTTTTPMRGTTARRRAGPACPPVPDLLATITLHGQRRRTSSLRGDFAADGWTTGIPMTQTAARLRGDGPGERPAGHRLQARRRRHLDRRPRQPAQDRPTATARSTRSCASIAITARARAAIDWRDAIMYFVMIDRFAERRSEQRRAGRRRRAARPVPGRRLRGRARRRSTPATSTDLGINTLWITSPLDNADNANPGSDGHTYSGYHGYWPKDETAIESHSAPRPISRRWSTPRTRTASRC